jgi:translation elongation factor EF-G
VRQTSCPGHYAFVTLRVEPHHGIGSVVFLNATQAERNTQAWVPAVEEGIRQFLADQVRQRKRIVGTRVVLTWLVDHPVDSRASSFEQATIRVMTQAFEAAGIPLRAG